MIVKTGALTLYRGDDPTCTPQVIPAGSGFVDDGGDVHLVRNEGSIETDVYVTSLVPRGAARRIDEPSPGNGPSKRDPRGTSEQQGGRSLSCCSGPARQEGASSCLTKCSTRFSTGGGRSRLRRAGLRLPAWVHRGVHRIAKCAANPHGYVEVRIPYGPFRAAALSGFGLTMRVSRARNAVKDKACCPGAGRGTCRTWQRPSRAPRPQPQVPRPSPRVARRSGQSRRPSRRPGAGLLTQLTLGVRGPTLSGLAPPALRYQGARPCREPSRSSRACSGQAPRSRSSAGRVGREEGRDPKGPEFGAA